MVKEIGWLAFLTLENREFLSTQRMNPQLGKVLKFEICFGKVFVLVKS